MPLVSNFERLAKEEGKQEGKQEGLQEGKQETINRLLKRKVGNFSPELEIKIRSLSIEKLEDLGDALLDFTSLNDLISWLDNN